MKDISDFLKEEVVGPGKFTCKDHSCLFKEPAMDQLLKSIFGDDFISLECNSGECLHYSQVPGFKVIQAM